jgi:hypothetical protein
VQTITATSKVRALERRAHADVQAESLMVIHRALLVLWKVFDQCNEWCMQEKNAWLPLESAQIQVLLEIAGGQTRSKKLSAICAAGLIQNAACMPENSKAFLTKVDSDRIKIYQALIRLLTSKIASVRVSGAEALVRLAVFRPNDSKGALSSCGGLTVLNQLVLRDVAHAKLQVRVAAAIMVLSNAASQGSCKEITLLDEIVSLVKKAAQHVPLLPYITFTVWLLAREKTNRIK